MPRSRRNQQRRRGPRRGKGRKRNGEFSLVQSKQLGQINRGTDTVQTVKTVVRFIGKISSDVGGFIATRFNIRNPLRAQDGAGTYTEAVAFSGLYDEYRPEYFVLRYIPVAPTGITPLGYLAAAFDYDHNDASNISVTDVVDYQNMRIFDPRNQFMIKGRIPRIVEGTSDTAETRPITIHQGGFIDFATPPVQGVLFLTGENFSASSAVGRLVLDMHMTFRRKR
jgi:hypothetical protein